MKQDDPTANPGDRGSRAARPRANAGATSPTLLEQRVLQCLPSGVIALDRSGRVTYANQAALNILERSAEECLDQPVANVFSENELLLRALAEACDSGDERQLDFSVVVSPDRTRSLGMSIVPIELDHCKTMSVVLHFRGIEEIEDRGVRAQQIERLQSFGSLIAGFAHELRNPVAGMMALAESLIAETPEEDPRHEYGRRIVGLTQRVESLVKSCLVFGQPEAPQRQACEPRNLIETAISTLQSRWLGQQPPRYQVEPGTPNVAVDPHQAVECLRTLIANAIDAGGGTSKVDLRVHVETPGCRPAQVHFEVRDQGPGIPAGRIDRIFEPFSSSKPRAAGMSLPTALVLASKNGGRIQVRSAPGDTVFTLILPSERPAEVRR